MKTDSSRQHIFDGLWRNHPVLVQLLGLSPLLAVTTTLANALGLGVATLAVLIGSSITSSILRRHLSETLQLPILSLLIAAWVTAAELIVRAYAYPLSQELGVFLPLIACNCMLLDRAQNFAIRNTVGRATLDAVIVGSGFLSLMLVVGAIRELFGRGTLFADMYLIFGDIALNWVRRPFNGDYQMLIASMPAGGFLLIGFLIAIKNLIYNRRHRPIDVPKPGAKRVRTTGKII